MDDADRRRFLETLGEACARTGWHVHAFVLMGNHDHFMIETPQANLVAGMRWFQTAWTMRYNRRHGLCGHLFQGRYQATVVDAHESRYFPLVPKLGGFGTHLPGGKLCLPWRASGAAAPTPGHEAELPPRRLHYEAPAS